MGSQFPHVGGVLHCQANNNNKNIDNNTFPGWLRGASQGSPLLGPTDLSLGPGRQEAGGLKECCLCLNSDGRGAAEQGALQTRPPRIHVHLHRPVGTAKPLGFRYLRKGVIGDTRHQVQNWVPGMRFLWVK